MKQRKRTYSVETRGGKVLSVTVGVKASTCPELPSMTNISIGNELHAFRRFRLPLPDGVGGIEGRCDMMMRNNCDGVATHGIQTLWASGDKLTYKLCEGCAGKVYSYLTPLCNTGSNTSIANS